jgi:transcriptional regulator with XRE-family HTH domain
MRKPPPVRRPREPAAPPEAVRGLRLQRLGLTQPQAAAVARIDQRTYQRWERGEAPISEAAWALLCITAGVPETWQPDADESIGRMRKLDAAMDGIGQAASIDDDSAEVAG